MAASSTKILLPTNGVDLLSDETGLSAGYVRRAENVDILRGGGFRRRAGHVLQSAGEGWHSLFSGKRGVLVGVGTELRSLDTQTFITALKADFGVDDPFDFVEYNGHTYVCNSGGLWWIPADSSEARRAGVALPNPLPNVRSVQQGALLPGRYAVAISRVDTRGEESPTRLFGILDLDGAVELSGLPIEPGARYRVYLTPPDGDVLYLAAEFDAVFATFVVGEIPDGAQRTTQHLSPMPGGEFVRWHAGRLYVLSGDVLHFSQPLRPHLTDLRHDFIQFQNAKFVEPVSGGIFVGDDRGVWFLTGNEPGEFKFQQVSSAVAMRRSSLRLSSSHLPRTLRLPEQECAVWLSTEGYMVGTESGQVIALHPDRVRLAATLEGRSRFVIRNGVKQIITLTAASATSGYGVALDTSIQ